MLKFIIILLLLYLIFSQHTSRKKVITAFDGSYEILGIRKSATDEDVKQAYREQSRKYHPDLMSHLTPEEQKHAENRLKQINAAYELIKRQRGI